MEPRNQSSKRWTSLPPELLKQVEDLFAKNFGQRLGAGTQFIIEGRIYPEELLFRAGFKKEGELRQYNFEVSMDFRPKKENALQQIHIAIDCAASMLEEYLNSDSDKPWDDFPKIWQAFDIQGKKAHLQVSSINSSLESEADRLLGAENSALVQGEDEEEDRKAVITMLGLDSETSEDENQ